MVAGLGIDSSLKNSSWHRLWSKIYMVILLPKLLKNPAKNTLGFLKIASYGFFLL